MQLSLSPNTGSSATPGAGPTGGRDPHELLPGRLVLLVEDEAMLAMELQFALEDAGAEVVGPALSLSSALQLLEEFSDIDGAILDVDIGGVDVFPVAQALELRGVPFLFHTGHGERLQLKAMFPQALVCNKPVPSNRLIEELARLIG